MNCSLASAHHFQLTLVLFTYQTRKQQDKGHYTGMVILHLQKAFDTVNHKILLNKLRAMSVGQIAVQWFNSYLSGRQQLVNIADTNSECFVWGTSRLHTGPSSVSGICK